MPASELEALLDGSSDGILLAATSPTFACGGQKLDETSVQVSIAPTGGTFFMKSLVRELAAAFTKDAKAGEA
jgi:hypothetical protein